MTFCEKNPRKAPKLTFALPCWYSGKSPKRPFKICRISIFLFNFFNWMRQDLSYFSLNSTDRRHGAVSWSLGDLFSSALGRGAPPICKIHRSWRKCLWTVARRWRRFDPTLCSWQSSWAELRGGPLFWMTNNPTCIVSGYFMFAQYWIHWRPFVLWTNDFPDAPKGFGSEPPAEFPSALEVFLGS